MWKCKKCGEEIEDNFDRCWKCETVRDPASLTLPSKSTSLTNMFSDEDSPDESASSSTLLPSKVTVIKNWYAPVPSFNTSTKEFYAAIEKQLKEQQVPNIEISRVDFAEGGILSSHRQYLRIVRERLVFDICAAPFGKSYFFSCRYVEIKSKVSIFQIGFVLAAFAIMAFVAWWSAGILLGLMILFTVCFFMVIFISNIPRMGWSRLDAFFLRDPLVGSIYEKLFHPETYYREDTRFMYLETVEAVVKAAIEETTSAKGIKLIKFNEYSPILGELYKPTTVQLPRST